jgi:beta-glucanase (GH16 family)
VIIAVTILVCGATLFANAEPAIPDAHKAPGPPAGEWQLVFDDEFSGSTLSLRKWELYDSPGEGGHGLRRPSAFSLDGRGDLVVTAAMVDGILVSGGMAARYDQAYGYYEVRVRTDPDPTGTLSGVVLTWPRSGNWPQDGENDLYETQDGGGHWPFRTFIHYGADNAKFFYTHRADSSQWHVVGMDWEPDGLTVYRDGVRVWRLTDPNAIPRVAHHVCIQLDAEGTTPLTAPVHMYVDYVRVWRLRTAARLGP